MISTSDATALSTTGQGGPPTTGVADLCAVWQRPAGERELFLRALSGYGYNGVVLPLPFHEDSEGLRLWKHLLQVCHDEGLRVWLRIEHALNGSNGDYLKFQTFDVLPGQMPVYEPPAQVVSAVAVARVDAEGAPQFNWNDTLWLGDDFSQYSASNFSILLEEFGPARVYLFSLEQPQPTNPLEIATAYELLEATQLAWDDMLQSGLGEWRSVIAGVSLRVPRLWHPHSPDASRRFPWGDDLPNAFLKYHESELAPLLPALVADTGATAVRVRQHFWQAVSQLMAKHWGTLWREWAHGEELQLRLEFDAVGLNESVASYGDIEALARAADAYLVHGSTPDTEAAQVLLKRFSSAAALKGQPGASVAFSSPVQHEIPASVWQNQTHLLLHAGANAFEDVFESVDVADLAEVPADIALNNKVRHGHFAAQLKHLQGLPPAGRIALLWPGRSAWGHHHPKGHRFVRWVEEDLFATIQLLQSLHFDWFFAGEADIRQSQSSVQVVNQEFGRQEAQLLLGEGALCVDCVVFPAVTTLEAATWARLAAWVQEGGKVVSLGLLPRWSEQGRDIDFETALEQATRTNIEDVYEAYRYFESQLKQGRSDVSGEELFAAPGASPSSVGYPVVRQTKTGGRFSTYQPRLNADPDDARLRVRGLLIESVTPELETRSGSLHHIVRRDGPNTVFWVWNKAPETQKATLLLRCPRSVASEYGPSPYLVENGQARPAPVWMPLPTEEGGGAVLSLELAAGQSRLLCLACAAESLPPHAESANFVLHSFDGEDARGIQTQNGAPNLAVRSGGKLAWWQGEPAVVPPPLLLTDEWIARQVGNSFDYSMQVTVPEAWSNCCVGLEVAPPEDVIAVRAVVDGTVIAHEVEAPWSFDVTAQCSPLRDIVVTLRLWLAANEEAAPDDYAPIARLVAYPRVELRRPE